MPKWVLVRQALFIPIYLIDRLYNDCCSLHVSHVIGSQWSLWCFILFFLISTALSPHWCDKMSSVSRKEKDPWLILWHRKSNNTGLSFQARFLRHFHDYIFDPIMEITLSRGKKNLIQFKYTKINWDCNIQRGLKMTCVISCNKIL